MQTFSFLVLSAWAGARGSMCPGAFDFYGYGQVSLTNTGYAEGSEGGAKTRILYDRHASGSLSLTLNDRAYFGDSCDSMAYRNTRYSAVRLLGKRMRYTTNISAADCGCNVAMYLVSMAQNSLSSDCGDYYCDANKVCGVACTEIDVQEANMYSWHSTVHAAADRYGIGGGYGGGDGWNGPRDFTAAEFGPGGKCVDTRYPFQVDTSFPTGLDGTLLAMEVELTQEGRSCPLKIRVSGYTDMAELSVALWQGMTPVVSYWASKEMLWMDGKGVDGQGPCEKDTIKCQDFAQFYDFSVEDLEGSSSAKPEAAFATVAARDAATTQSPSAPEPPAPEPPAATKTEVFEGTQPAEPGDYVPVDDARAFCTETGEDCRKTHCCKSSGMQCFEKNAWWATCKETCIPGFGRLGGDTTWTCRPLGERTRDAREHNVVVLSVAQEELPPSGAEVTLVLGDKQLLAKVVQQQEKEEKKEMEKERTEEEDKKKQEEAKKSEADEEEEEKEGDKKGEEQESEKEEEEPARPTGEDEITADRSAEKLKERARASGDGAAAGQSAAADGLDSSLANKTTTAAPSLLHA